MSYAAQETSVAGGAPVELFEFNYGPVYFRYTSATDPVVYLGRTFEPSALKRPAIRASARLDDETLRVEAHISLAVAELFRVQPPSDVVTLTIWSTHTTDAADEFAVVWSGRVLNAGRSDQTLTLECEPSSTSLNRPGLRRNYQVACPHVLYGPGCNLLAAAFATVSNNFAVLGNQVSVQELVLAPDRYFAGGYVEYENPITRAVELRNVVASVAGLLTLALPPIGLVNAGALTVYRGCAHTVAACKTFGLAPLGNLANYGGQPYIPAKNPFGGTSLF